MRSRDWHRCKLAWTAYVCAAKHGARDGVKHSGPLDYGLRLRRPWFARFRFSRFMACVARLGFAPLAPVLVANGITPKRSDLTQRLDYIPNSK